MRKTKSVIALGLALSLMLCSCGSDGSRARKSDSGQNTPGIASGSISDMGGNGSGSGDNGNGNGSSYDKPQIRIDIKDEKHADFILNTNSIIDTSFDDLTYFTFYMPDQYELEWESAGIGYADG
nr:hypothetical protein [Lachnospiraceae bacterium]